MIEITSNSNNINIKATVDTEKLIQYLQGQMDEFKKLEKEYGFGRETKYGRDVLMGMIACKEMVEALIGYPVNLQKDGKVTVGF